MAKKMIEKVKITGMERNVDRIGRIVIPFEYRKQFGMNPGEKIILYPTNVGFFVCKKDVDIDKFLK